jgi:hypothetical protein
MPGAIETGNSRRGELTISGLNPDLVRIFRWHCVEYLL